MVQGKVNFIHVRPHEFVDGMLVGFQAKGGETVAWRLEENGELTVFAPARCRSNEHYVKSLGRDEALKRVVANDVFATISFEELHRAAVYQYETVLQSTHLGPDGGKKLVEDFVVYAYHNLSTIMSNSFFEAHVRKALYEAGNKNAFN